MKIAEIMEFPTHINHNTVNGTRYHESLLRSFHILRKVKDLLGKGTPPDVVLEIIEHIESVQQSDLEIEN